MNTVLEKNIWVRGKNRPSDKQELQKNNNNNISEIYQTKRRLIF